MGAEAATGHGTGYYGPFAQTYDAHRPRPSAAFVELACCLADVDRPHLVVDLGSGTGLSTEIWAEQAHEVIGVEPDGRMRAVAESRAPSNVRYVAAAGEATGLDDSCADIVTACCSLHWMDLGPTLAEVARILRPGGVFATSDVVRRSINGDVDAVLSEIEAGVGAFAALGAQLADRAERLVASGYFRSVRELTLSSEEPGDADRVVGLVLSHGQVARRLATGEWTERGLGLPRLQREADCMLGDRTVPFVFTSRLCLAVR